MVIKQSAPVQAPLRQLLWLLVSVAVVSGPVAAQPSATPLALSAPITRWDEGIPIGNGLMGVLVWGEGNTLRLSLDRADLWDTRLPEVFASPGWTYANMVQLKNAKNHAEHIRLFDVAYDTIPYPTKLPIGRLEITLPDDASISTIRAVAPRHADISLEHPNHLSTLRATVGPSAPVASLVGLPNSNVAFKLVVPTGFAKLGFPPASTGQTDDESWFHQQTLANGSFAVAATRALSKPPHPGQPARTSIAVAIVSSKEATDPLAEARARATAAADFYSNPPDLGSASTNRASSVALPDPAIQAHYDLAKHLYIAGSRPDAPPLALQGVWTADNGDLPPWKGDYHNDLNTQMTYLAYHDAGLLDQGLSWINFNWNLLPAYRSFAKSFYATAAPSSAVVPGVMTIDGKPMGGWGQYSLSPTHSAWIAQSFYLHWKYTNDATFLHDRAAPFCNSIANALAELLTEDPSGVWKLPLSSSPEFHDNSYAAWLPPNSTYDQSLLAWLFQACHEMAQLGTLPAVPLSDRAQRLGAVDLRAEFAADSDGLAIATGHPYDQSHRHFSHAMAIYPLGLLTPGTDDAVITPTLDRIEKFGTSQWVGYSFSWFACMNARAGRPERALHYLTDYLAFTGRNGFHLNGDQTKSGLSNFTYRPFTLEGNFLAMQAVHEMLLQSWGTVGLPDSSHIRIFPAVSEFWSNVSFENLRAEGGWKVSARRESGRTTQVSIASVSGSGGVVRLQDPFIGGGRWSHPLIKQPNGLWTCNLQPGETLLGTAE